MVLPSHCSHPNLYPLSFNGLLGTYYVSLLRALRFLPSKARSFGETVTTPEYQDSALAERARRGRGAVPPLTTRFLLLSPAPLLLSASACSPSHARPGSLYPRAVWRWEKFGAGARGAQETPRAPWPPPARGWVEAAREERGRALAPQHGPSLRTPLPARIQRASEEEDGNKYL